MIQFVIFGRKRPLLRRQHYFRIIGRNGEVLAQSEGYTNPADRDSAISLIKGVAADATIRSK